MSAALKSSADGWRGQIGAGFDRRSAARLAAAALDVLAEQAPVRRVLIGYDGRRGGAEVAAAIATVVTRRLGAQPVLTGWLPTPIASAAVTEGRFDLALLVTASHNPASWNGLKLKYGATGSLGPALEARIESRHAELAFDSLELVSALDGGTASPVIASAPDALIGEHLNRVLGRVGVAGGRPWRVVVDGLNGIAGTSAVRLARLLGWRVHPVACDPDPDFGFLTPDPALPAARTRLAAQVVGRGADFGIVLDGDGDRVFLVGSDGQVVESGELYALLLGHLYRSVPDLRPRAIAVTTTTTSLPGTVAAEHGGEVLMRPVGFKNMGELISDGQICAAGGSVGDLAFARYGRDRDPSVVLALLARLLVESDAGLDEVVSGLRQRYGRRSWLETAAGAPAGPLELDVLATTLLARTGLRLPVRSTSRIDGVRLELPDGQWLAVRRSTTEELVRAYAEFASDLITETHLQHALCAALRIVTSDRTGPS
ncbi:MAG: phosphoglucomutase [Jatrophihabitans sp.]